MKLHLPMATVVAPTKPSESSTPTSTSPLTTPRIELVKRAEACGNLQGAYPNAIPPTCAGSASICTFTAGYQGCCDGSDNCAFYTSCQGGLVPASSMCSAAGCLQCPSAVPYCTQYKFTEGVSAYLGFACGSIYVGDLVVQGTVGSQLVASEAVTTSSSVQSSSSSSSSSSSLSSTLTSTSSSRITSSTSGSAAGSSSTADSTPSAQTTGNKTPVALIAGPIVGGVVLVALIIGFCMWRKRRERKRLGQLPQPEQSERYYR